MLATFDTVNQGKIKAFDKSDISFTRLDHAVMNFLLLNFMNTKTGLCLPNQSTIAKLVGCSRQRVNKAIAKWRKIGVLGVVKRKCRKPSTGIAYPVYTSCFYYLTKGIYKRLQMAIKSKAAHLVKITFDFKKVTERKKPQKAIYTASSHQSQAVCQFTPIIKPPPDQDKQSLSELDRVLLNARDYFAKKGRA